jgi:hypothetical protein
MKKIQRGDLIYNIYNINKKTKIYKTQNIFGIPKEKIKKENEFNKKMDGGEL